MKTKLLKLISQSLRDTKLADIKKIEVKNKFYFADYFFITTASSSNQARSCAKKLKKILNKNKINCKIEGINSDRWILVDTPNCIVHIFINQYRKHYDLEGLWGF